MKNIKRHELKIKDSTEDLNEVDCPLPLDVIPNYMGINLCAVDSISWEKLSDGQIVNLTIKFDPDMETFIKKNGIKQN